MYAVFKTGGKQHRVTPGDTLRVERLPQDKGASVEFDDVLLIEDSGKLTVSEKDLKNTRVTAKVLENGRAKKIIVFKMKRRKGYRRKYGHRQQYTTICIEDIKTG